MVDTHRRGRDGRGSGRRRLRDWEGIRGEGPSGPGRVEVVLYGKEGDGTRVSKRSILEKHKVKKYKFPYGNGQVLTHTPLTRVDTRRHTSDLHPRPSHSQILVHTGTLVHTCVRGHKKTHTYVHTDTRRYTGTPGQHLCV